MSDIREYAAKASFNATKPAFKGWWDIEEDEDKEPHYRVADEVLIAIEPHLRRKHRQELLQEMLDQSQPYGMQTVDGRWFTDQWLKDLLAKEAE